MCDPAVDEGHDEGLGHQHQVIGRPHPSRRLVLAGAFSALSAPLLVNGGTATGASPSPLTGETAVVAAMHVHGSFSEQEGSWQGQVARAAEDGVDLLFMTDHSHRMLATSLATSLADTVNEVTRSGQLARGAASFRPNGSFIVSAESSRSTPASTAVVVNPTAKTNRDRFRSSVMGQVVRHRFDAVTLPVGGFYEVRFALSHHTATAGRADGDYQLCYRFGATTARRFLEDRGTTAVVELAAPTARSTVALDLERDAGRAWPDLVSVDNATQSASFSAVSPRPGVFVSVEGSVEFARTPRRPSELRRVQQQMADRYGSLYDVQVQPAVELGDSQHHNAFTADQYFSADEELSFSDPAAYARANVAAVHAVGGLVSWNHPFGVSLGTPRTGPAADSRRRAVYAKLARTNLFGSDILEVGYGSRGGMDTDQHLALWDSFSRNARFLTGNGVSDSHDSSRSRSGASNAFTTGLWTGSTTIKDVIGSLAAGSVWTGHTGRWPGGQLDLLVDGRYAMGQVVIGSPGTRRLAITATSLPRGSVVEVVAGLVDGLGTAGPGTRVVTTLPATAFARSSTVAASVAQPGPVFVRLTVRNSAGEVIGVGNPVWFLDRPPVGGVPGPRQVR